MLTNTDTENTPRTPIPSSSVLFVGVVRRFGWLWATNQALQAQSARLSCHLQLILTSQPLHLALLQGALLAACSFPVPTPSVNPRLGLLLEVHCCCCLLLPPVTIAVATLVKNECHTQAPSAHQTIKASQKANMALRVFTNPVPMRGDLPSKNARDSPSLATRHNVLGHSVSSTIWGPKRPVLSAATP